MTPIIKGGQGRTTRQVRESAASLVWFALIGLALVGAIWGAA